MYILILKFTTVTTFSLKPTLVHPQKKSTKHGNVASNTRKTAEQERRNGKQDGLMEMPIQFVFFWAKRAKHTEKGFQSIDSAKLCRQLNWCRKRAIKKGSSAYRTGRSNLVSHT